MMGKDKACSIPEPPGYPFLGNLFDIDMEFPLKSLYDLAEKHGEIYRMKFPGHTFIIANSYAMVNEFCDEKRFPKTVFALQEMRHAMHDGLFTATGPDEANWGIAHRVLLPAFGPTSLRNMYEGMYDVAAQMVMKWARHGKTYPIAVTDDMTKLTLDTIALCSMDFRFNSYYHDGAHPFVAAMTDFLVESGNRMRRLPIPSFFYRNADKTFFRNIKVMRDTAREILEERKRERNLDGRKDLLSAMLSGVDPKTGQKMTEESILDNLVTFLIAGHETTAGTLSFALYHIIKDREIYRKAQTEVDNICGTAPIKFEHISQLSYLSAILRETLRLTPPLPVFNVAPKQDQVVGGQYVVKAEELVIVLIGYSQVDPKVFGETAKEFDPERLNEKNFERLNKEYRNAWKPFGNGSRGCIGRPFAWQEAVLVLAMLLQNFDFEFDDPNYTLSLKQTLTVKPNNFRIKAVPRGGVDATELEHRLAGTTAPLKSGPSTINIGPQITHGGRPMSIYYGSNMGTCQSMAELLAADAFSHGFRATIVACLDNATGKLPTGEPVVIITASYEGQPPDNAAQFVAWLEESRGGESLQGVNYAVFGCGNHDWTDTFHRIPKLVDAFIEKNGGCRVAPLGLSDVAKGTELTDFEMWQDEVLWPALMKKYDAVATQGPALTVEVTNPRKAILHQDVREASVVSNDFLTPIHASIKKKHMEIQLPAGMTYRAGDYLTVLPVNPKDNVQRVLRHFHLAVDAHLTISANARTPLPDNVSISAADVFGSYVELAQPATKRDIHFLASVTQDQETIDMLHSLAEDATYTSEIIAKRVSILDLLEANPTIALPLSSYLRMLLPMKVRQYSISSSPLWNPNHVTLTYSILDEPSLSSDEKRHVGVATTYFSSLEKHDVLPVLVRPSHAAFHLPEDAENKPVIMIAAGTGIAPFRGFVQERASMATAGAKLAPAVLYFGCQEPGKDDLYSSELAYWESQGVVLVLRAYSRRSAASEGCRYVQDRLWKDRERVIELWERGAQLYICGSRAVGESVKDMFIEICVDARRKHGEAVDKEDIRKWFEGLKNVRYAVDVFN